MTTVNVHEAKTQLSRLIEAAEAGEEVIIARAGKPVVRLMPLKANKPRRQLGMLAGQLTVPEDFDAPLADDVLDSFYTPL